MPGLYANQQLQGSLDALGPVDRFPRIGERSVESIITLAIATAPTGHVQVTMSLDMIVSDYHTIGSRLLAAYPFSMHDLAYADALLVSMRLGVSLRVSQANDGWRRSECDDGPEGQDTRIILPGS